MPLQIGTFEQLHSALGDLAAFLKENGACDEGIFKAKLAVSELVTNAIRYTESGKAEVEWRVKGSLCELKITHGFRKRHAYRYGKNQRLNKKVRKKYER